MFLIVMVIGLVGLAVMAVPAFLAHGAHGAGAHLPAHGHGLGHHTLGGHAPSHGAAHAPLPAHGGAPVPIQGHAGAQPADPDAPLLANAPSNPGAEMIPAYAPSQARSFIPSPRGVLTVLALFGAFGNAAEQLLSVPALVAALVAVVPTLLVERFLVRPLWNLVFRFQAPPAPPLDAILLSEAIAVVPFRNGRGIVSTNRDGRLIQLSARLRDEDADALVKVGDRLCIEQVDAAHERVTVSLWPSE